MKWTKCPLVLRSEYTRARLERRTRVRVAQATRQLLSLQQRRETRGTDHRTRDVNTTAVTAPSIGGSCHGKPNTCYRMVTRDVSIAAPTCLSTVRPGS